MDPRMIPQGSSSEYNYADGGPRRPNDPGVYFHPGAQKFVETAGVRRPDGTLAYHQEPGKIQADAFVQMGYRPASKEEAEEYQARQKEIRQAEEKKAKSTTTTLSSSK